MSLWGQAAKILVPLPNGDIQHFFLKTVSVGQLGRTMVRSEFESLKAIRAVSPSLVPLPHAWGRYDCDLEMTDIWEGSCSVLYQKQLAHMIKLDQQRNGVLPEFQHACKLVVEKVIPRLLEPLQSSGRTIKPCLVHGDLWDENTATDVQTGQSFIFDAASFYAHNEYELGDWRANRHLLNDRIYVDQYKRDFPPSEPRSEWDDRNLLYSFRFDLGTLILIPGCPQRDM
ncbi:hypothetical protein HBI56_235300 [Parastagonospora nodorum]|nr:hypothetical protein HBH52_218100 [Parastagonospora nodorum]KAH4010951.1 hypothetical protein HBI09_229450 [Parastagonospora nodorum]KAH4079044.1 hypothetical protein HBH46_234860 [Parastagonospora nodorum]KAH4112035.1 hypothetical protein HBH47_232230 [Parastagonospora nodorum]KAH4252120.1 hypothetical protein HBI03_214660 [Parastagonospora nodorum]